jgi:hypothetical protein
MPGGHAAPLAAATQPAKAVRACLGIRYCGKTAKRSRRKLDMRGAAKAVQNNAPILSGSPAYAPWPMMTPYGRPPLRPNVCSGRANIREQGLAPTNILGMWNWVQAQSGHEYPFAFGRTSGQTLRRDHGGQRPVFPHRARRMPGRDRPQRCGQNHHAAHVPGLVAARWRQHGRYFDGLQMPQDALAIKARLGVVAQMDTLDPDFTAEENLCWSLAVTLACPMPPSANAFPQLLEFGPSATKPRPSPASCRAA